MIPEAQHGSRDRLKRIRQLIERADTLEQAIAVARGEDPQPTWRWPCLIRSLFGVAADRLPYERVLGGLENAAPDSDHIANCRKEKLLEDVLAAVRPQP